MWHDASRREAGAKQLGLRTVYHPTDESGTIGQRDARVAKYNPAPSRHATSHVRALRSPEDEPGEEALVRSLAACERIVRARAKNFWFGLALTPRPRRDALHALYAWMRLGDDLVDEPAYGDEARGARRARFASFAERSRSILEGVRGALVSVEHDADWQIWPAFAWLVERFPIRRAWLDAMLEGLASDLGHVPLADEDALDAYCHRVAGTVGMCCASIWGLREDEGNNAGDGSGAANQAMRLADLRGKAFQLVNIARDIGQDHSEGRCYVPATMVGRHGLSAATLGAWGDARACEALVREWCAMARGAFEASRPLDGMIQQDCVAVLGAMTDIYKGVLSVIEREPARCVLGERASLASWRKVAIAGRWAVQGALEHGSSRA